METKQDGMRAVLTVQKYVPLLRENIKGGVKETRQLVLTGDFNIFVKGQQEPVKLPCKLEFKKDPSTVQLVQTALNVEDTGEECLLVIHSNRKERLTKYKAALESHKEKQKLEFAPPKDEVSDEESDDESTE